MQSSGFLVFLVNLFRKSDVGHVINSFSKNCAVQIIRVVFGSKWISFLHPVSASKIGERGFICFNLFTKTFSVLALLDSKSFLFGTVVVNLIIFDASVAVEMDLSYGLVKSSGS